MYIHKDLISKFDINDNVDRLFFYFIFFARILVYSNNILSSLFEYESTIEIESKILSHP